MNEQKHIINRQVLELTVPERGRAQLIQNKASEIVRQKLHPALDALFSNLSGKEEIIRFDKLVIDLGTISENELENEFVERTIKELKNKINILLKSEMNTAKLSLVNGKYLDVRPDIKATSKSIDSLEQFVYFLQNGHFPWWHKSSVKNGASGANANKKLIQEALNVEKTLLKNAIIPLLKKTQVRKRLVFQFNHSHLYELLKKLNQKLFESYSAQFQYLLSCSDSAAFKKTLTDSFYEIVLDYFSTELELNTEEQKIGFVENILDSGLSGQSANDKEKILTEILRSAQLKQHNSQRREILLIMVAIVQMATELPSMNQAFQDVIQNLSFKNESVINTLIDQVLIKAEKLTAEKANYQKSIKNAEGFSAEKEVVSMEKGKERIEEKGGGKGEGKSKAFSIFHLKPDAETEQIMIYNAGLVLIHPFLKYFFEGLNLLDNKLQFKSESEAFKAVHLLQFIATGGELTPEADLPLNKIICGLDVTEPVPLNINLSEEEKEECLFLIKTVLERWEALKTTNPAALRETFLQREGILKPAGQSWNLTIERNTFDVMLERLPWSFSLVKLPWCEQILYVEW